MSGSVRTRLAISDGRGRALGRAALAAAAAAFALALLGRAGDADAQRPGAPSDASLRDGGSATATSEAMDVVLRGNERYLARDYAGAIDLYKTAIQRSPRFALAHYVLGEAHVAAANLAEAEAAFRTASELTAGKEPRLRGHVLFALADVYEREKKWDLARAAWQTYAEHASKVGADGGAHPESGAARLKAVDEIAKLEKQYEGVRARIAAERDAGRSR